MASNGPCPCLCGCAAHLGKACTCGCERYAPNYLATLPSDAPADVVLQFREWQRDLARQLGYRRRGGAGVSSRSKRRRCGYCGRTFEAERLHASTCSGACRQALSVALKYASDADVAGSYARNDTFSKERRDATGFGLVTAAEGYRLDLRARRVPERERRKCQRREPRQAIRARQSTI